MRSEGYSDSGADYGAEDFGDDVAAGGDEEAVEALQGYINQQVDTTLSEHQAAEAILARHPEVGSDPETQASFLRYVEEQAERAGVPTSMRFAQVLLEHQAGPEARPRTPSEVFDEEVLNSPNLGSRVLDFNSSD